MKQQIISAVKKYTNTFFITPINDNKSIVMMLFNYAAFAPLNKREYAQIDAYYLASNASYHKANTLAEKLYNLGIKASYNSQINYKKLSHKLDFAGVGKNTLTYVKTLGSRFVMQAIEVEGSYEYLALNTRLQPDCNSCNRCVKACPTGAISIKGAQCFNYKKCLRYLQESSEDLTEEQAKKMQNKLLGCDICQAVCPYNKGQKQVETPKHLKHNLQLENLLEILKDAKKTKQAFAHLIGKNYAKQKLLVPNALIVANNSNNQNVIKSMQYFKANKSKTD